MGIMDRLLGRRKPRAALLGASPNPQRPMAASQYANKLRCAYCSHTNAATAWPRLGDTVPFYYQTREETDAKPGAYHVPVHCPDCGKDWFVVRDNDPS
jgi:hypothetical protein